METLGVVHERIADSGARDVTLTCDPSDLAAVGAVVIARMTSTELRTMFLLLDDDKRDSLLRAIGAQMYDPADAKRMVR